MYKNCFFKLVNKVKKRMKRDNVVDASEYKDMLVAEADNRLRNFVRCVTDECIESRLMENLPHIIHTDMHLLTFEHVEDEVYHTITLHFNTCRWGRPLTQNTGIPKVYELTEYVTKLVNDGYILDYDFKVQNVAGIDSFRFKTHFMRIEDVISTANLWFVDEFFDRELKHVQKALRTMQAISGQQLNHAPPKDWLESQISTLREYEKSLQALEPQHRVDITITS